MGREREDVVKLVYIAGPYSGPDYLAIDRNIAAAREAAAWLAEHGIGFFCPHLNSAHFEVVTPRVEPEFWYALDLRLLEACDALLFLEGWQQSKGAKGELDFAAARIMPVFFYPLYREELLRWAKA